MKPCLAQVCSLGSPFDNDVEQYAAGHCHAIEIWLGKLETFLEQHSAMDVRRLLDEHEMQAEVASFQGGLLTSQGDQRKENWDHLRQRLSLANELKIETIVIAADIHGPLKQKDIDRVSVSLAQASELADQFETKLALEFQASATFGNNLQTAVAMVEQVNSPSLGICLDVFHFFCGPSKLTDLDLLTRDNLFHVQLCDLAGIPREFASDADRILPGDGELPLEPILERLRAIGYDRFVSVELMNPQLWQVAPRQFGEIAITALRKLLGIASMS